MAAGPSLDDRDPRGARRTSGGAPKRSARAPARRGGSDRPPWLRTLLLAAKLGVLALFIGIAAVVGMFAYYGSDPKMPNLSRLDY